MDAGWQPSDTIAIVAIAATVTSVFLGAWLNHRSQERQRKALALDTRRREAGAALAPVIGLLLDVEPLRVGVNASDFQGARLAEVAARWPAMREALHAVVVAHPDQKIRDLAKAVAVNVQNSLHIAQLVNQAVAQQAPFDRLLDEAQVDYSKAEQSVKTLSDALREYED